ncbi:MAG: endonuclease [Symploca sp. SIO2B6]|nr:endonuclease [Symploca sp. SIO2B6]
MAYDPNFLGQPLPLPSFSPELEGLVLRKPELDKEIYAHYHNYTVVMHRELRTPLFAALNIDQDKLQSVKRSKNWYIDTRVGAQHQLDNDYYYKNPWDRGHLARRAAAAWGDSPREAKHASDETFFFTNAVLQHQNFNQDEWLALEDWVKNLSLDSTNKISVISGPIFGEFARSLAPGGRPRALIPSAFFKVVGFINKQEKLEIRSFIMAQDELTMEDMRGKHVFEFQRYQVSITEIEELTGLRFSSEVPDGNPLFFNENATARENLNVTNFPERIEVDSASEMVGVETRRETIRDQEVPIFIAAALINASGDERLGEWVSIINLSNEHVDLSGWSLKDPQDSLALEGSLAPGEAMQVAPLSPIELSNQGGTISLYNQAGERIDRVKYPQQPKELENKPFIFAIRNQ